MEQINETSASASSHSSGEDGQQYVMQPARAPDVAVKAKERQSQAAEEGDTMSTKKDGPLKEKTSLDDFKVVLAVAIKDNNRIISHEVMS